MLTLNPYALCSYRCTYCSTQAQGVSTPVADPETYAAAVLAHVRHLPKDACVVVGVVADPYPPIEEQTQLTRRAIEVLTKARLPFVIVTKGTLVARDADLLRANPFVREVVFSLCSHDETDRAMYEPYAPSIAERRASIGTLMGEGIPTAANIAPWIPGVTRVRELVQSFPAGLRFYAQPLDVGGTLEVSASAARLVDGRWTQREIDQAYLADAEHFFELAYWAFPVGSRTSCVARMSREDLLLLRNESSNYPAPFGRLPLMSNSPP